MFFIQPWLLEIRTAKENNITYVFLNSNSILAEIVKLARLDQLDQLFSIERNIVTCDIILVYSNQS